MSEWQTQIVLIFYSHSLQLAHAAEAAAEEDRRLLFSYIRFFIRFLVIKFIVHRVDDGSRLLARPLEMIMRRVAETAKKKSVYIIVGDSYFSSDFFFADSFPLFIFIAIRNSLLTNSITTRFSPLVRFKSLNVDNFLSRTRFDCAMAEHKKKLTAQFNITGARTWTQFAIFFCRRSIESKESLSLSGDCVDSEHGEIFIFPPTTSQHPPESQTGQTLVQKWRKIYCFFVSLLTCSARPVDVLYVAACAWLIDRMKNTSICRIE